MICDLCVCVFLMDSNSNKTDKFVKKCRVCGDVAYGYNFGGLSCESCKAFFRRNGPLNEPFQCRNKSDNCLIETKSRIKCKKCRLTKCFAIGMKKELVKDKKVKRSKVKKISKTTKCVLPNVNTKLSNFELEQISQIQDGIAQIVLKENFEFVGTATSILEVVNMSAIFMKNYVKFCKKISAFRSLNKDDQLILLKCAFPEIISILIAYMYDVKRDGIPIMMNETGDKALFCSFNLSWLDDKSQLANQNIVTLHRNFALLMNRAIGRDTKIRDLLIVQLLFKIRPNIQNQEFIQYSRQFYVLLLKRYLEHKFHDAQKAKTKYGSLCALLAQLEPVKLSTTELFAKELNVHAMTQICAELFDLI